MEKMIRRTIETSKINWSEILMGEDGEPGFDKREAIHVTGLLTIKQAEKIIKESFGKEIKFVVTSIEVEKDTYEISVDAFMTYGKKVEKKTVLPTEDDFESLEEFLEN